MTRPTFCSAAGAMLLALTCSGCTTDTATSPRSASELRSDSRDSRFSVNASLSTVVVPRSGEGSIAVTVVRRAGFSGAVHLALEGEPRGVRGAFSTATIGPGAASETVTLRFRASDEAENGHWPVQIRSEGRTVAELTIVVRDLPLPTVALDTAIVPIQASAADESDPSAPRRPVARLADSHSANDFIEDELVISSNDAAAVARFAAEQRGRVVAHVEPSAMGMPGTPSIHLVRFEPARSDDTADLIQNLAALSPDARGDLRVSTAAGMRTLALAARAGRAGLATSLQMLAVPESYVDRVITEAPSGIALPPGVAYSANPFDWQNLRVAGSARTGVAESWRALELAGRLGNRISLAVVDQGFSLNDLPASTVALGAGLNVPSDTPCSGSPCPWHGTGVAQVIAAGHDNNTGTAGVATPVVDLTVVHGTNGLFAGTVSFIRAAQSGARVINMSKAYYYPALISYQVLPFNAMTSAVASWGVLIFAPAGNDGRDVDSEDCFIGCWEDTWVSPCENDGVICVGGSKRDDSRRDPSSAYGAENVDIYAPFYHYIGATPGFLGNTANESGGTSLSSPYMAGVAALVWAANPALTGAQVASLIMTTSRPPSGDPGARFVNALGAVRAALGPQPPTLTITSPAEGGSGPYGVGNFIVLRAVAHDVEDLDEQLIVTWSSDIDGPLGTGLTVNHAFVTPGPRNITAIATDSSGRTATRTVRYTAINDFPNPSILEPSGGATVYRNVTIAFRGMATDTNDGPGGVRCDRLIWSIDIDPTWRPRGCAVTGSFNVLGPARVTMSAFDSAGLSADSSIGVTFVDPPLSTPPIVAIIAPADGERINPRAVYRLTGTATDPDGTPVNYLWSVLDGALEYGIEIGASVDWRPSDTFPVRCGTRIVRIRLQAFDAMGQRSETFATVTLDFGPC